MSNQNGLHVNLNKQKHGKIATIEPPENDSYGSVKYHIMCDKTDTVALSIIKVYISEFSEYNFEYHLVVERAGSNTFKFIIIPHPLWHYLKNYVNSKQINTISLHIVDDPKRNFTCVHGFYSQPCLRSVDIPTSSFCESKPLVTIISNQVLDTPPGFDIEIEQISFELDATKEYFHGLEKLAEISNGSFTVEKKNPID